MKLSILLLSLSSLSHALPSSSRLFQKTYTYKVSCYLCHSNGGGSALNNYGKTYLRAGANAAAFKKIEGFDSDEDGLKNLAELLAKSNPGDRLSTPQTPSDWLANTASTFIPQKELENLFPGMTKFSAVEGSLNSTQINFLKSKLGQDPQDDDIVPTFYFAEKDGKRVSVGQFISGRSSNDQTLNTAVAVATNGKILKVDIVGGSLKDEALKILSQDSFINKTFVELSIPQEKVSKLLHENVKRSLVLIQAVFGGAK